MPAPPPTGPLVTRSTLIADLRAPGVRPGGTLLPHSSLSALGGVCGGAVFVVQGLLHTLRPDGKLTVPTHTGGNSDPARTLGAALERDGGVVRGRVGAADALLFPVADAVAYPQGWPARHRS
ncbi:AAC(3) family N-acetyltransferase [Streptomyces sp. NPDC056938]|uniref:AAC(3) family N-acetyltransferase n=1 Tax=unclassified Streptomyces TaxID=2593676 RepID=UPI003626690C